MNILSCNQSTLTQGEFLHNRKQVRQEEEEQTIQIRAIINANAVSNKYMFFSLYNMYNKRAVVATTAHNTQL